MKKVLTVVLLTCLPLLASASDDVIDCENAMNTIEINQCAAIELETAQVELEQYLEASFEHNDYDAELVASIKKA
ncbi:hypothetical protein AB6C72_25655, partial [Vibrio splendidus]